MIAKKSAGVGASRDGSLTISCPTCGKPTVYSEKNPVRPFCSRTCQTGDLAAWASDEYAIPTTEKPNQADEESREFDTND